MSRRGLHFDHFGSVVKRMGCWLTAPKTLSLKPAS